MITKMSDMKILREKLEQLTDFIRHTENKELPYFYRFFDAMKNNIDIFLHVGEEDFEDFFPFLERDWKASHTALLGVQYYHPHDSDSPENEYAVYLYFAGLIAEIGKYFER